MSITGTLVGYENNNDLCNKKNRSLLNVTSASSKQCTSLNSSISNSVITTASNNISASKSNHDNSSNEYVQTKIKKRKHRFIHLNTLWSIWYGVLFTYLQGYLVLNGAYRYLGCYLVEWRNGELPLIELNAQIILCLCGLLMLPIFFVSALFKVGNLANDGIKLATSTHGKCSAEPEDGLEQEAKGGTLRAIWTHGGPTSAFIHILIALCLLIPRLLLESKLIKNGNLPRENIWHTELNFMLSHRDRLVVLSFTTSPYQNNSIDDQDNINKNKIYRPTYFDEDGDVPQTHLIEKFHPGGGNLFDDSDYFGTHEKMEVEKPVTSTPPPQTTLSAPARDKSVPNNVITPAPTNQPNTRSEVVSNYNENIEINNGNNNGNNRKHAGRQKNRNNRKYSSKERNGEKGQRRGDSESHEKQYKKYTEPTDVSGDFAITKLPPKKYTVMRIEPSDEIPIETGVDVAGNKKSTQFIRDSNIHVVKPADGSFVPSTPFSTNSKIIEIKPSTIRTSKRTRRSMAEQDEEEEASEVVAGIEMNVDGNEDEMFSIDDEDVPEPRIYVNVDNNEQFIEDDNVFLSKPAPDAVAAALIGSAAIPAAVNASTTTTATPKELTGFAACLQHYLNVHKEVDVKNWTINMSSFEFMNFVVALIVWSSRYPSVFWATSKPFSIIFSIQMIANAFDLVLGFAGVSVLYKLKIVGQQLPLQTPPMLLNGIVSLLLYILSLLLITSSSMILYLYGHGRLSSRVRDRRMISTKSGDTWAYFAHCASLCFILALAVVKAPLMHDFTAIYKGSLDTAVLVAALSSVMHIFFWILLWLGLTAKRRWNFKLPPLNGIEMHAAKGGGASMPLLMPQQMSGMNSGANDTLNESSGEETIYWPKLAPNSPKLKVTFNDVPSTLSDNNLADEQDGKRNSSRRTSLCITGEIDEGDYATLRAATNEDLMHFNFSSIISASHCDTADDTSEEGKLLDCVRDDSVTYASTRDLEPPMPPPPPPIFGEECDLYADDDDMPNPMPPVTVTVHTIDAHMTTSRSFRRADSGMPNDVLSPHSESTDCSTSPPERTTSDHSSSSGIHSGEEREEVVIRPRQSKIIPKPSLSCGADVRSTNMVMSSFSADIKQTSATLPMHRAQVVESHHEYSNQFNTMPLPINSHQQQYQAQQFHTPNASKTQLHHTTLPNDIRYANPSNFIRRVPIHVQTADSPYGILGLGAGHHTFSKLLHEPLIYNSIPEDRDSANCSMISEQEMYANAATIGNIH